MAMCCACPLLHTTQVHSSMHDFSSPCSSTKAHDKLELPERLAFLFFGLVELESWSVDSWGTLQHPLGVPPALEACRRICGCADWNRSSTPCENKTIQDGIRRHLFGQKYQRAGVVRSSTPQKINFRQLAVRLSPLQSAMCTPTSFASIPHQTCFRLREFMF